MSQEIFKLTEVVPTLDLEPLTLKYFESPKFLSYKPKTQEFYRQGVNHFLQFTTAQNLQDLSQLTRDSITKYIEANNKTTTIYRKVAALRGFIGWAFKANRVESSLNPMTHISINRKSGTNEVIYPKYPIRNF